MSGEGQDMTARHVIIPVAFLCVAQLATAEVLVSNVEEPVRASSAIGGSPNLVLQTHGNEAWFWAAQSFVTNGAASALHSIEVLGGRQRHARDLRGIAG